MANRYVAVLMLQIAPFVTGAAVAADAQVSPATYTVTLHCHRLIPLTPAAVSVVYSWALKLISSSQENSKAAYWTAPSWEVEQEYRDVLSADYLRVDFGSLATIKTMGGTVRAHAIVQGLDSADPDWRSKYPDHFVDSLFTLDENGAVVGHAQYSGNDVFALGRVIGKALIDSDACARAKVLFVRDSQLPPVLQDFLRQNNLQN